MNNTIDLNSVLAEQKIKQAMPVLKAPERLDAKNIAVMLAGREKRKTVYWRKYASVAAAALLVLVIGLGIMGLGRTNLKEAAPEYDGNAKEYEGYSEYDQDGTKEQVTHGLFGGSNQNKGEMFSIVINGVSYNGYMDEAVPYSDENAEKYLGMQVFDLKACNQLQCAGAESFELDADTPLGVLWTAKDSQQDYYYVIDDGNGAELIVPLEPEGTR